MIPMLLDEAAVAMGAPLPAGIEPVQVQRVVTDSRVVESGDLFVALSGKTFDGHQFVEEAARRGAVACLVERGSGPVEAPGRLVPRLVVPDAVAALGQLAVFYRRSVMPASTVLIAVTGSNGKTTTKRMIDHILAPTLRGRSAPRSFNNHLGVPLTLLSAGADDRYLIVEIGDERPGEVASLAAMVKPHVGVITSIGEAHLEGLGDIRAIAAEKASLLTHVRDHGFAVINIDRREIRPHLPWTFNGRLVTVGLAPEARLRITDVAGSIDETTFILDGRYTVRLPMPGPHHAANAAAAFAVGRWFGLAPEEIVERLRTFSPPAGRTRRFTVGRVTVVDDTYNANPPSMLAAVAALQRAPAGRRVFVMGDMLELGPTAGQYHRRVVEAVAAAGIETLIVVGPVSVQAARSLHGETGSTRVLVCEDQERALAALATLMGEEHVVWIKGSRGMELDRLVRRLETHIPAPAAVA